eukprot:NODE_5095_length_1809_cov_5.418549.p1 GENE.NODE_5095_length_1809_cov_5.418549~~NODE_5095_length_1809_cov_5.418549.p1  ORF type:complete len:493 (-),score=103.26 NODE_5095_length_1809_cov_5.418549:331-1749(-)
MQSLLVGYDADDIQAHARHCVEKVRVRLPMLPNAQHVDPREVGAIYAYTDEDVPVYKVATEAFSAPDRTQGGQVSPAVRMCLPFYKLLDVALQNLPESFTYRGEVFRGVKWCFPNLASHSPEALRIYFPRGDNFYWYTPKSTSKDSKLMQNEKFCGLKGAGTIFKVDACRAYDIEGFSKYGVSEKEVLLPMFAELVVTDVIPLKTISPLHASDPTSEHHSGPPDVICVRQKAPMQQTYVTSGGISGAYAASAPSVTYAAPQQPIMTHAAPQQPGMTSAAPQQPSMTYEPPAPPPASVEQTMPKRCRNQGCPMFGTEQKNGFCHRCYQESQCQEQQQDHLLAQELSRKYMEEDRQEKSRIKARQLEEKQRVEAQASPAVGAAAHGPPKGGKCSCGFTSMDANKLMNHMARQPPHNQHEHQLIATLVCDIADQQGGSGHPSAEQYYTCSCGYRIRDWSKYAEHAHRNAGHYRMT